MKKHIILLFLLFCSLLSNAQTAPQVFINIDPPTPICNAGDVTTLQTNFLQTYSTVTNNYIVNSIPYALVFGTTGGTPITTANEDDIWSSVVTLSFPFCFYGQNYNHLLVGSNGVVSFNIDPGVTPGGIPGGVEVPGALGAPGYCDWSFNQTLPSTTLTTKNAIYGVYQDTDIRTPPVTNGIVQNINFYETGTAPNRAFIVNFNELPMFSCNGSVGFQTSQIILYETTNVIDVLVTRRTPCNSWQGGVGVIGVMNQAGTLATVPPGRNTGTWSATNEAWRFQPSSSGASNVTVEWFSGSTSLGPGTSTGVGTNTLSVSPSVTTTYTTRATYIRCDGVPQVINSAPVTLNVEPPLPIANPVPLNICGPAPYTFNINQYPTVPSTDYIISYHTSLANAQAGTPFIPAGSLATYASPGAGEQIWVRIEDNGAVGNGCVNFRPFTLNGLASPSGAISYTGSPYCAITSTPQLMTGTITPGGVYSATPVGLSIDTATGAINPSLSTPGTYAINYNLAASGSCPAYASGPVSVTISPAVLTPGVSDPAPYCQNATASALTATGTALLWYTTATGGVGSATAPVPSTLTAGTTSYYVSQTVSGCEGPRATIVVTVIPTPLAPTFTAPAPYCQNATATALTAIGSNLLWYTTLTGGVGSATAPIPTTTAAGTINYYVSQTVSGCESQRSTIPVVVNIIPPQPIFTAPAPYCQNATATALTATGSNLLWYTTLTGGVGSAIAPIPSTVAIGTINYYVSQTILGCEGPRATIPVVVNSTPPQPTFTAPAPYCQNAPATALTASGSNLLWYTTLTGGVGSATAPIPTTTAAGTINYYVSQTVSGCESQRSTIPVVVNITPPQPTFTAPAPYCQNAAATALTATGSNLLWYTTLTGGVGSATAPIPTTTAAGTINYYVSQTVSGCESQRSTIPVVVNIIPPQPIFTAPAPYCQNAIATALTATGSNLLWYTTLTGGVGSAIAPIPSTVAIGTINYYVSQTILGCEGPRATIPVVVNSTPPQPTFTAPAPYCQNAPATALTASGSNLLWYTTLTGGVGSATAPIPTTTAAGTINYYVSQTVSGCESQRSTIPVVVNITPPQPMFTAPAPYCQNAAATALTATGSNLLWYTTLTGGVGSTTAPIPTTTAAGTINYYVSQTVSGCESQRSTIPVVVNIIPPQPIFTAPAPYCQNATATALTATGSNLLWYTTLTGGVGSAIAPIPSTVAIGTINYYVSQTILGCEGPRATIPVVVNSTPPQPTFTAPAPYCQNAPATALTASGSNLLWYTTLTGGVGSAIAPIPSTATAGTTTYYVSQTIGCESPRAAINVIVNATPSLPQVDPVYYCINDTANPLTAIGTNLLWYTTATGGVGSAIAPTPTTVTIGTITYYVTQTINGCEGPRAPIAVLISEPPASLSLVTSNYFSELQMVTITVLPLGNYEYQLDNGPFQTTNVFTNVGSGQHSVTVRNQCDALVDTFTIIDYPKFFTPNGDGYHDTWNIFALSDQPNAKIYIFDRLGKLIKEIRASGEGWNGTFNGAELPSTDYWFTIQYSEDNQNKEFKSHFALKR